MPSMGGFFSPATLEQIRAASDIVDVIGAYVPLKRAGANFVALCPFHKEKTPSFNVNPQKQIFHCFGCHKGGDVFAFVKEYENIDFPDAVRRLAERAQIPLETDNQPGGHQKRGISRIACFKSTNKSPNAGRTRLANERRRPDGARLSGQARRLGRGRETFPPRLRAGRLGRHRQLGQEQASRTALMEQAGLILRKEGADHYYDRFRGRLMFPICDEQGRVIGFSGRILSGDEKTAKYVNSPETPIFTKGKVMFGLDKSKRALLDAHRAIICEGQLDLIACFMAGVQNIVAPQGTALTADHARILKRYVDEVVLCFDSDNAGQNAAVRSLDSLLASGLAIRVAAVPAPHDPDSFIKEFGGGAFAQLIEKARRIFRLLSGPPLRSERRRHATGAGAPSCKAMAEAVHKTGNDVLLDTYAQKTALRLGVAAEAMRQEFKKSPGAPCGGDSNESEEAPAPTGAASYTARIVAAALLAGKRRTGGMGAAHLELAWLPTRWSARSSPNVCR